MASLVILAAGLGSRYGSTKQFEEFGPHNRLLIEYTIYDAIHAGFDKIVFVIRKENEDLFNKLILKKWGNKVDISIVYQEINSLPGQYKVPKERIRPWGTAHAIWMTQKVIKEPFAVVNADDFYGREAIQIAKNQLKSMSTVTKKAFIVAYKLGNTLSPNGPVSRGICSLDREKNLIKIKEITAIQAQGEKILSTDGAKKEVPLNTHTLVSMNLLGFTPSVFKTINEGFQRFYHNLLPNNSQAEYYIATVLNLLIEKELKISVIPSDSTWFGVTHQKDKDWVNRKLAHLHKSGVYPNDF